MKEIKKYICSSCGTEYTDKNKCVMCENNHKKPVSMKPIKYRGYKSDNCGCYGEILPRVSGYPYVIEVKFDNGIVVKYTKASIVDKEDKDDE